MFGRLILDTYVQDRCRDVRFKDEHLTWFEIKKNDAKRIVKRMGWESLADFLNNYTWDDTEILYQIETTSILSSLPEMITRMSVDLIMPGRCGSSSMGGRKS